MIKWQRLLRMRRNMAAKSMMIYLLGSPMRRWNRFWIEKKIFKAETLVDRFTLIYESNLWLSAESVSGSGSSLFMTESIRKELPILLEDFGITSMLDAPCGDFSWMILVDLKGIRYTGVDIVKSLIDQLQSKYASSNVTFRCLDVTRDFIPKNDLVLSRDLLFHLSYSDILLFLQNYLASESKYFLTTSYDNDNEFRNSDIISGGFRLIDLFLSPFEFPSEYIRKIPEPSEGRLPSRKLYLWDREQIEIACRNLEAFLSKSLEN